MDNLNNVFFEEFKRLDNLCRDIYRDCLDGRLGVTLYLHDMDSHFNQGKSLVPFWVSDYKQLKRLRNIRNELAHSQDSFSYLELTQADIDFIRKFREKILNCTDPISLLNNKNNISSETTDDDFYPIPKRSSPKNTSAIFDDVIIFFIITAIVFAIIFAYFFSQ